MSWAGVEHSLALAWLHLRGGFRQGGSGVTRGESVVRTTHLSYTPKPQRVFKLKNREIYVTESENANDNRSD